MRSLEEINRRSDTIYDINKSGLIIETTLDYDLHKYALSAFKIHLGKMQQRLNKQYSTGADKSHLDALVIKELNRLNYRERRR